MLTLSGTLSIHSNSQTGENHTNNEFHDNWLESAMLRCTGKLTMRNNEDEGQFIHELQTLSTLN